MTEKEKAAASKIAKVIKTARKHRALTQHNVAEHLGVSQSAVSKMENGLVIPSAIQWYDFCVLTGIRAESLCSGEMEFTNLALKRRPARV
ncbi:MAG TPA: helix-turn-helix transcriptional regulator [Bdellovibrionota bacterium]|nr:helix-turn-helix transcriptional regulator [Bdellovibrionota bacterium]